MKHRLAAEEGFTMIELLVATALMAIVFVGIVNIFVSGTRAGADANARLEAQQNTRLALDRIEYEGRCAQNATLVGGGSGVAFTLPSWCTHTLGETAVAWCVSDGVLSKALASDCSGTGQEFVDGVTTAAPFALPTPAVGDLPQLTIDITVNPSPNGNTSTASTLTDTITLRNADPATS